MLCMTTTMIVLSAERKAPIDASQLPPANQPVLKAAWKL